VGKCKKTSLNNSKGIFILGVLKCLKYLNEGLKGFFYNIGKALKNIILKWGCIHKTKTITIIYGHLKGQKSNCQNEYEYQSLNCLTNGSN
jgi:hypothetical protein